MHATQFSDVPLVAFSIFAIFLHSHFRILMNRTYTFSYPENILYSHGIS